MEKRLYEKQEIYDPATIAELSEHYAAILRLLGEDPTREGLLKTPERVAKAMAFMTKGYAEDPRDILLSAMFREEYRQMVLVRDIEVYSLCEHHMLPFYGKAHVAYIPDGYITGLSKVARVVECFARRLQVQERLTVQIRDCIHEALHPLGVAVVIEASHMCMQMRGVEKQESSTTTSAFTGIFLRDHRTREEFMELIRRDDPSSTKSAPKVSAFGADSLHAGAQANARNSAIRRRTPAGSVDVDQFDPCGIAEPVVILIAPQPNSAQRLHRPVFDRVNVASGNIQLFEQVALTRERVNLRRKYKRRQPVVAAIYRSESEIAALRKIERRKRRSGTGKTTQPATVAQIHLRQCRTIFTTDRPQNGGEIDPFQSFAVFDMENSRKPRFIDSTFHLQPFEIDPIQRDRTYRCRQIQLRQRDVGNRHIIQLRTTAQIETGTIRLHQ